MTSARIEASRADDDAPELAREQRFQILDGCS